MPIIDAQVHCYERDHPGRPWAAVLHGPAEMTGADMVAAMDEAGVDGALLVSVYTMYRYDPSYAIEQGRLHRDRLALVRPVDPTAPDIREQIADWAAIDGTVAVRLLLAAVDGAPPPALDTVMSEAARHGLVVNVHGPNHLDVAAGLAARYPATAIVIDHIALHQPLEPPPPTEPWAHLSHLLPLAQYPNVHVKISNACTLSHEPFPYRDIWDPLWRVFDAFGIDRCIWGTDWTRATGMLTYKQGVDAFLVTDRLSAAERDTLMGGALARVYGWSPTGRAAKS